MSLIFTEQGTKPVLEQTDPKEKKSQNDTFRYRVVVVCPYTQFNMFFEQEIPDISKGAFLDVVDKGEYDNHTRIAYLDVAKRERGQAVNPRLIIDFNMLQCILPKKIVNKEKLSTKRKQLHEGHVLDLQNGLNAKLDYCSDSLSKNFLEGLHDKLTQFENDWEKAYDSSREIKNCLDILPFNGYRSWAETSKIKRLSLLPPIMHELVGYHVFDDQRNIIPAQVHIETYVGRLRNDLRSAFRGDNITLGLFTTHN